MGRVYALLSLRHKEEATKPWHPTFDLQATSHHIDPTDSGSPWEWPQNQPAQDSPTAVARGTVESPLPALGVPGDFLVLAKFKWKARSAPRPGLGLGGAARQVPLLLPEASAMEATGLPEPCPAPSPWLHLPPIPTVVLVPASTQALSRHWDGCGT